jgi:lipopolysaccharide transport system ATP-binding protein
MAPAIVVSNLCKTYRLGSRAPYATFREAIMETCRKPWKWLRGERTTKREEIEALRNVSFRVEPGEVVGVIGRNGAGKSTLLKILSRITEPTRGEARIHGRVGSLLEVGTGFHPELTGRDNIYLNGAILGMSRREISAKFDAIVSFAELDRFLDTPVKHYSSGMYMRLAFAVAAHLDPEILVVDEVLAVGDAQFQKKCLGKMGEVARGGRTVLFVSHNMGAVQKICSRALLLEQGELVMDGHAGEVTKRYLSTGQIEGQFNTSQRRGRPTSVEIIDAWLEHHGHRTSSFLFGDSPDLVLVVQVREKTRFSVELLLRQQDGLAVAFAPSGLAQEWEIAPEPGTVQIRCHLPPLRYASGVYSLDIALAQTQVNHFDYIESALAFHIETSAIGHRHWAYRQSQGNGFLLWEVAYNVESRITA